VQTLRAQDVRVAVVSSSNNCAAVLEAAGITQLFDVRVDGRDISLLLGDLFGLTPELSMALSLAKRVRELVLGIPGSPCGTSRAGEWSGRTPCRRHPRIGRPRRSRKWGTRLRPSGHTWRRRDMTRLTRRLVLVLTQSKLDDST
jgi:hypothetical protein